MIVDGVSFEKAVMVNSWYQPQYLNQNHKHVYNFVYLVWKTLPVIMVWKRRTLIFAWGLKEKIF